MTFRSVIVVAASLLWLPVALEAGQLFEAAGIRGLVAEAGSGLPLQGVVIHFDSRLAPAVAVTDAGGRFFADGLEPGVHLVFAERPGMVFTEMCRDQSELPCMELTLRSDRILDVEMQMRRGAILSGRVEDEDGDPVAGVRVSLQTYDYASGIPGERVLADFPTLGETHSRDLADCRGWLSRTVPEEDLISRCAELASANEIGRSLTNEQGEWRLEGVPPGQYFVRVAEDRSAIVMPGREPDRRTGMWLPVYFPGTPFGENPVPVAVPSAYEIPGIDIRWTERVPVAIRGTLTGLPEAPEGPVIPIGGLTLRPDAPTIKVRTTSGMPVPTTEGTPPVVSDAEIDPVTGDFELLVPPYGDYVLTATAGRTHSGRLHVQVGPSDVDGIRWPLAPDADVAGLVIFDPRPTPEEIADVWVTLSTRSTQRGTPLAPDGTFVFEKPGQKDWEISMSGLPEGYYPESANFGGVDLLRNAFNPADAPGSLILVRVGDSPGAVIGRVVDARGDAFGGAKVTLVPEGTLGGRRDLYKSAETDAEGRFSLAEVPPGGYRILGWESIPESAERNAGFLAPYRGRGRYVTVERNGTVEVELPLIPR